jgi:4-diphosphocytidyl-2-C-methyl-D-erythritol kinase
MIYFPNAKINLGLQVIEKREDGFHNIITCLYPVGWCDILEIMEQPVMSFKTTGLNIPGDQQDNLCLKAYYLVKEQFDIPPIYMHLHKVVPIGAGLGGGSSDAAFTLLGLNQMFKLAMSNSELIRLAAKLGSDCAFFIKDKPALATGIGDQLEQIDITTPGKYLLIVMPPVQVDTGMAYQMLKPKIPTVDLKTALNGPKDQWPGSITNDFEDPIFMVHPAIAGIKEKLLGAGANYASMSGSGSSVYGFFDEEPMGSEDWFGPDYMVWRQEL